MHWNQALNSSIREARIEVVGKDDIKNEAQGRMANSAVQAFGKSAAGFIFFEPSTARSSKMPPDILICHPEIGLLTIEVKGWVIEEIQNITAGTINRLVKGRISSANPIRQAEDSMYDIKDSVSREIRNRREEPLVSCMVALPNISESDWSSRGFTETVPNDQFLFKEHASDPKRLEKRIREHIKRNLVECNKEVPLKPEHIKLFLELFGDSAVINEKRKPRELISEDTLGFKLDETANLDKKLSREQQELSRLPIDGFPRLIRGVAGSGKTVVLANLAARYINRVVSAPQDMFGPLKEDPRVAIICFNRALVQMIWQKVKISFECSTMEQIKPIWIDVMYFNGLMYRLSENTPVNYIKIANTTSEFRAKKYIEELDDFENQNPDWFRTIQYDAIFVDEGQDLEPIEFELLLKLIKKNPMTGEKNLIIFYDDAQNLYARNRPIWKDIGIDVQRGDRSKVMRECFRNTKEIVELAFNVLLGSQAPEEKKIQTRTFADLNYLKQAKLVEEVGDHFRVRFTDRNGDKPIIKSFKSRDEEKIWLADEIGRLIEQEEVRPEDILVLYPKRNDFEDLSDLIQGSTPSIQGFVKPQIDKDNYIFRPGYLTLSTTNSAKGYDAAIVFLIGTDDFNDDKQGRASFYVGATRAKMLLYITGLESDGSLLDEAKKVLEVL